MAEYGVRAQNTSNFGKQAGRSRTKVLLGTTLRVLFILAIVFIVLIPCLLYTSDAADEL